MPDAEKVVIFDVDGVLIDSLPQHLQVCRDKAREFGLDLKIPTIEKFRDLVSKGTRVSPMREFFLAMGFTGNCLDKAVADYDRDFSALYRPPLFDGAAGMLRSLRNAEWSIGLVTANVRENVVPALGDSIEVFEKRCMLFHHKGAPDRKKSSYLVEGAQALKVAPWNCIYVGDQPADALAAKEAGMQFLGVTYGWGITRSDTQYETVNAVEQIPDKLAEMRRQLLNSGQR
jgi:phosphoglycolate phosphatase